MKAFFAVVVVIGLILLMLYLRIKSMQKPIGKGGLSILYPLFVFLIYIFLAGSQLFVDRSGTFVLPQIPIPEVIISVVLGCVLAIPMLLTTNYELRENQIYFKSNKIFIYTILGLFVLRLALRNILSGLIPVPDQLFLMFIMAIVYVTIWRVGSFVKFRKLLREVRTQS